MASTNTVVDVVQSDFSLTIPHAIMKPTAIGGIHIVLTIRQIM